MFEPLYNGTTLLRTPGGETLTQGVAKGRRGHHANDSLLALLPRDTEGLETFTVYGDIGGYTGMYGVWGYQSVEGKEDGIESELEPVILQAFIGPKP